MTEEQNTSATYHVEPARRPHRPMPHPGRKGPVAILVAHGMGQQVPFETLNAVARGLLTADGRRRAGAPKPQPVARTVRLGDERLQRLEMKLGGTSGAERDVHVYEAYWAPLTEGQVTLRDVAAFLVGAARLGVEAARLPFRRWLFGRDAEFPAPVRTIIYLLVAFAVLLSLGVLNAVIVAMAAARAPMQTPPAWLSDRLFTDVTTILNILVVVFTVCGATIATTMWLHKKKVRVSGWPSLLTFGLAVWTTIAAAITVAVVVAYHAGLPPGEAGSFFDRIDVFGVRPAPALEAFNRRFDVIALWSVATLLTTLLLLWIWRIESALHKDVSYEPKRKAITNRVRVMFFLLVVTLAALAIVLLRASGSGTAPWTHGLAWPLTIAASAIVRWFLIEFAGDVAVYVQPQVVDRFYELRRAIKECVWRTTHAVYSAAEYEDIIVVGHSLGSVVAYDVLNRMILDRDLDGASAPVVVPRTRLLLTFGSPLDKTAFLFGIQGPSTEEGAARRALAASVQPMITQAVRPPWVNVYSAWDIISGALDYYDLPDQSNASPVRNERDTKATTFLAAHVEYWTNPIVFETILNHLP